MLSLLDTGLLEKKIFKIHQCIFCNFVIITSWKRVWPFIWTNLNALQPRRHCCKFGWNLDGCFWRRRFFNFVNVFLLFQNYLPLEKDGALNLKNLNPLHPRMLCAKTQWFWRRRWNCEKFATMPTTTMTTKDNGQILIRKAHLSLWLRWAKIHWVL